MKTIDINNLSYDELLQLNRRIIDRLKHMDALNNLMQVHEFQVGEVVHFTDQGGRGIQGVVSRLNKKSVSIVTPTGENWKVSPQFLKKAKIGVEEVESSDKIIDIRTI